MNNRIIHEIKNKICTITLNNPKTHNAIDNNLIIHLTNVLKNINNDETVRAVILRAQGKNFSAGADLNWMRSIIQLSKKENVADALRLSKLLETLNTLSKPTIALIQGRALGGAIGLIACCDIAIANQDAAFCFSEVKLGLIPATIAPYVIRCIGYSAARSYFISAEWISVEKALHIGLIHKIAENKKLYKIGLALANNIIKNAPHAMNAAKRLVNRSSELDPQMIKETAHLLAQIRVSEEAQEGINAFLEKREPKWI